MIKIYNLINKIEFLEEVATLEYEEWANNKEKDKNNRIHLLDIIRGILIIYVVYYHFMYDKKNRKDRKKFNK